MEKVGDLDAVILGYPRGLCDENSETKWPPGVKKVGKGLISNFFRF